MKIGFLGLSDYGFSILKFMHESNDFEIVFTSSKSKKMNHIDFLEQKFEKYCFSNNLNYLGNINANNEAVVDLAKETDLCVIGGYDKILKKPIIGAPKLGIINTHFGLIPENRGCNPTMWAILEDIDQGFTTYYVNENIDYGNIISKVSDSSIKNVTVKEAYDKITNLAIKDFPKSINKIKKNISYGLPRNKGRYFKSGIPNNGYISLSWDRNYIKKFSDALWFPPYKPAMIKTDEKDFYVKVIDSNKDKITLELFDENTNF